MKLTLATLAVLATAVVAAPAVEDKRWCERPGQSCWKAKREAEAIAEAEAEAEAWCERPGQSCWKAKREVAERDVETEVEVDTDSEPEPEVDDDPAVQDKRWCERPGQSCWKARRDAAANAWCERPGQPCWKVKRAAEALFASIDTSGGLEARSAAGDISNMPGGLAFKAKRAVDELAHLVSLSEHDPEHFYNGLELEKHFEPDSEADSVVKRDGLPAPWCERPGQSCWKRDAEADAHAAANDKRWCERPGQSCWKARRAAEAVLEVVGSGEEESVDMEARGFDPEFAKRDAEAWCERPGQSCRRARRDLYAVRNAAEGVLAALE